MHYFTLAIDFDGTLAHDGRVGEPEISALERLRTSGRRIILVTGREHDDLIRAFPRLDLFDRVVAENGGVLIRPAERETVLLAEPPPRSFVEELGRRGVSPLSTGRVVVSSWHPNETVVLETIRALGLEHQVIFNKGAVMVLPPGVNKATGLQAALDDLDLSAHNVVGIGDAENDHAFLQMCGCAVAVANALPMVKETADLVTAGARGAGVMEIVDRLLTNDLADLEVRLQRHVVRLAVGADEREVILPPRGAGVLLAGTSGSGKSTLVQVILERLAERGFQFCVIDPEGDYDQLDGVIQVGDQQQAPKSRQVIEFLEEGRQNVVVNLLGISLIDRPPFFTDLLSSLTQLRIRTGRPHWIVIDEAHHMLPAAMQPNAPILSRELGGLVLVTVHPDHVSANALSRVELVIAIGQSPDRTIQAFCEALGERPPSVPAGALPAGEALAWSRGGEPVRFRVPQPRSERRRHLRKYAEGALGQDKSFYFRGPDNRLNLRVQNLGLFVQIAEGVDDATWLHHLRAGDYSRWFREAIKDEDLAEEASRVEADQAPDPTSSRERIREAIERRYTGSA